MNPAGQQSRLRLRALQLPSAHFHLKYFDSLLHLAYQRESRLIMTSLKSLVGFGLGLYFLYTWIRSCCAAPRETGHEEKAYVGECNEQGQYHGPGVLTTNNGDVYSGNFVDGTLEGLGELTKASTQATVSDSFATPSISSASGEY